MFNISAPFIHRPVATWLLMAGLLFVGIIAYPQLPVAPLPQIDFPTIQVSASLPGASPETMATTVAQPLETQFALIAGVSEMSSVSTLGSTQITVQFDLDRSIDGAANDLQAAINAAGGQLPKNLPSPPTYRKVNPADSPIMVIGATSDSLPLTDLDDNVETKISQQISQLPGVGLVSIGGQQKPSIRLEIDPAALSAKGLTLEDLRTQIGLTTVNSPKGSLNGETRNYTIYDNDQLTTPKDWNSVVVAYVNGSPVRVMDVGKAVTGPQDETQAAWANGKRGVFLVVFKQPGANVIDTVDAIKAALPRLSLALPPSIKIEILSDRTLTIRAAVSDVQRTLALTILLVVLVIFVFLRSLWATIIPSVTVPLALLGAVALMWAAGYSLDNLSLMALTISVGFVVDDAIVMLENITRYLEKGETPLQAALKGSAEIGFTILSISLSLVAVLIPLLLMSGVIGRLFREFSVTLAMTILVSGVVSLTLTPMMASKFLKPHAEEHHGRLYALSERGFDALIGGYRRALDVVLNHTFIALCVFFLTVGATVWLFVIIPKGFFPQQDTGLISGISEGAQDISFTDMARHQVALANIVQADPDVATVASSIGGSGSASNAGRMYITLKPLGQRKSSVDQVIARLRGQLDKVEGARLFLQAAQDVRVGGRSSRTQYQLSLGDADANELNTWAPKLMDKMKSLPMLRDVATDQEMQGTTLTLTIDRQQASRFGVQPQQIDDTLYDAFGQRQVAQYFTQTSSYYVILEVPRGKRGDPQTLDELYVHSPLTNANVPLSSFAHWTTTPVQPLSISHSGQFPAVTLSFNLAPNAALGDATAAIAKAETEIGLPPGVQATFQGTAQAFQDSLGSIPLLILGALIVVYIILGVLYESFIHPLTILSTLPSAGLGALGSLYLAGYDFSLIALVGVILLIGIVKKNGIMMVDFAIAAEKGREGHELSAKDAIREAALLRFRPIMMTTMAAMLGALPLMLGTGTGSELRQPLGYAMVGGLLVSQALTLFTTPVIYVYLDRLGSWAKRRKDSRGGSPASAKAAEATAPSTAPAPAE